MGIGIRVEREKLSDGFEVFNLAVTFPEVNGRVTFEMDCETAAINLEYALAKVFDEHDCNIIGVDVEIDPETPSLPEVGNRLDVLRSKALRDVNSSDVDDFVLAVLEHVIALKKSTHGS